MIKKSLITILTVGYLLTFGVVSQAYAAAFFKLTPSTGSYQNGNTFTVTLGVNSGGQKSAAVDAWMVFDPAKLEVVSVDTVGSPAFSFSLGKNIYNSEGRLALNFSAADIVSIPDALNGDLVTIQLKAKSSGTATLRFNCTAGELTDTGIYTMDYADIVDCGSNVNGSYTITDGGSNPTDPTSTPVPTNGDIAVVTQAPGELPRTGAVETTVGLLIFGIVGVLAGSLLKWL